MEIVRLRDVPAWFSTAIFVVSFAAAGALVLTVLGACSPPAPHVKKPRCQVAEVVAATGPSGGLFFVFNMEAMTTVDAAMKGAAAGTCELGDVWVHARTVVAQ